MEIQHTNIFDNLSKFTEDQALFLNYSLEQDQIKNYICQLFKAAQRRLEYIYKSSARIEYINSKLIHQNELVKDLQGDHVLIKLLHINSNSCFYFTIPQRLARIFIVRLLATELVDEESGLSLSKTEKGILSFIVARLIADIKNALPTLANIKLLGIYNNIDDPGANSSLSCYNFSFSFDKEHFLSSTLVPIDILSPTKKKSKSNMLKRLGHIRQPMSIVVKSLLIPLNTLAKLSIRDSIFFNQSSNLQVKSGVIGGKLFAYWWDVAISGSIVVDADRLLFKKDSNKFSYKSKGINMEEIVNQQDEQPLLKVVQDFKVPVSIEISRVSMSLKEICALRDGEIVDLNRSIDEPLEMVVDNKVIGYCQPVQVNGHLGIKILKINDNLLSDQ